MKALEHLADAIEHPRKHASGEPVATPVGIHLEGPFVSHGKRGVHPEVSICEPSVELFDRLQAAARGHIRLMTMAPELPHALELIEHAKGMGVRVSMGHSMATSAETLAAIAAGATSSTHLFNAMRPLDHREPGIVGTILDRDDIYAEAICDGVHLHPAIIRLWLKLKGEERGILVTDGMSATGVPDGTYTLGDFEVVVKDGVCLAGDTLAGSVLTMDRAVANVQKFTGTSLGCGGVVGFAESCADDGNDAAYATYSGYAGELQRVRRGWRSHGKHLSWAVGGVAVTIRERRSAIDERKTTPSPKRGRCLVHGM